MVNLITTLIAIALMATVAMFGLDYGTRGFEHMQARNQAMQIIVDSRMIMQGWQNYRAAHDGNYLLTDINWSDGTATDLVTPYLNKLPVPPSGITPVNFNFYFPIKLNNFATSGGVSTASDADTIALRITNPAICTNITKLADGGVPTAKAVVGGSDDGLSGDLSVGIRHPYDCIYIDSNASGNLDNGDAMLFVYNVFYQAPTPVAVSVFNIQSAIFGSGGFYCDATSYVRAQCQNLHSCSVISHYNICGDPYPGHGKALTINYDCGSGALQTQFNETYPSAVLYPFSCP